MSDAHVEKRNIEAITQLWTVFCILVQLCQPSLAAIASVRGFDPANLSQRAQEGTTNIKRIWTHRFVGDDTQAEQFPNDEAQRRVSALTKRADPARLLRARQVPGSQE